MEQSGKSAGAQPGLPHRNDLRLSAIVSPAERCTSEYCSLWGDRRPGTIRGQALLYVGDHDHLYAIDGQRGRVLWCRRLVHTDSAEGSGTPEFAALRRGGRSLYSGTEEGRLVALDADSGQVEEKNGAANCTL